MEKIKSTKLIVSLCLLLGILNFLIFAYDLENDKDWMTYGWLLCTIFGFCMFIIYGIKLEILRENKK